MAYILLLFSFYLPFSASPSLPLSLFLSPSRRQLWLLLLHSLRVMLLELCMLRAENEIILFAFYINRQVYWFNIFSHLFWLLLFQTLIFDVVFAKKNCLWSMCSCLVIVADLGYSERDYTNESLYSTSTIYLFSPVNVCSELCEVVARTRTPYIRHQHK